jgi:hypothetical protein
MVPRLEDEDHDKSKNNEQKKEDVLPPASVLLVPVEQRNQKEARRDQTFNRYQAQHVTAQTEWRYQAPLRPRSCGRPSARCCIRHCRGVCLGL